MEATGTTVLVVDDDGDVALLCRIHLETEGYGVIVASDGRSGLAAIEAAPPDAVVLDYMLPDMDGLEVLGRLRGDPRTASIPVLMVTARADVRDQQAAWDAGVSDYITKPFDRDRLIDSLRDALAPEAHVSRARRQREATERLRARDVAVLEHQAAIVEQSEDAIISCALDGRITTWNRGATALYGYEPDEVLGQSLTVLMPPDDPTDIDDIIARIGRGERVGHYEAVRQRKDGRLVEVSISVSAVRSGDGSIIGAAAIARDVTERRRADDRFRALVETAPDATVIVDQDGYIQLVNTQTELLFGYERDELIGQPVEVLVPVRYRDNHPAHRSGYSRSPRVRGMGAGLELHGLRKDGTEFPVEISLSPLQTEEGVTISAAIRDVSERKEAEAMFRDLLEAAPDAIVGVDADGHIQLVNAQAEALFGYARDELLGQTVEILVPEQHRRGHPAHRLGYFREPRTRAMGEGLDLVARRRDGTQFPAEISLSSIRTEAGVLVSAAIRDVTERKQAEARFRGLVEAAPDAMVIVDEQGRIQLVNAQTERLFGYDREALLGKPVEILIPERFRSRHPAHRIGYTGSPRVRGMGTGLELTGLRADGREFPVEISLSPLQTEQGVTISAAIRDVTERKQAEDAQALVLQREREAAQRLRQADRLRSDFLSTVSHELRTPLTTITGFTGILLDQWADVSDEQRLELIGRVASAGGRLDDLIGDLLDFTRLEGGLLRFTIEDLEVGAVAQGSAQRVAPGLDGHRIVIDVPAGLVVRADSTAIGRTLDNLIANAGKFSAPGTTITVRAEQVGDEQHVSVADEGIGIPADELDRVFERFYRVGGPSNRRPGTGIGLAIVKEFTEDQGGRVDVRSELGVGTTFTVVLPAGRPVAGGTGP